MTEQTTITMNQRQDNDLLAEQYQKNAYVNVAQFLDDACAHHIHQQLQQQKSWNLVCNNQGVHKDMDFEAVSTWTAEQRQTLDTIIYQQAANDFQYYYATIPIYDLCQNEQMKHDFFSSLYDFVNSPDFLHLARTITGNNKIKFADIQATRYSNGHFLKQHDDNVHGKNRIAAYVLNLSPAWQDDWGGALIFSDNKSLPSTALFPRFNSLNIFSVPQKHAVSMVTPFAQDDRYSITGWLRY